MGDQQAGRGLQDTQNLGHERVPRVSYAQDGAVARAAKNAQGAAGEPASSRCR